jgi:hypothetical protein
MCMNCGCGRPDESHGHPENLTADDIRRAGDVNGQSMRETAQHILATLDQLEREQGPAARATEASAGVAGREALAEPAGHQGADPAPRGTPESES